MSTTPRYPKRNRAAINYAAVVAGKYTSPAKRQAVSPALSSAEDEDDSGFSVREPSRKSEKSQDQEQSDSDNGEGSGDYEYTGPPAPPVFFSESEEESKRAEYRAFNEALLAKEQNDDYDNYDSLDEEYTSDEIRKFDERLKRQLEEDGDTDENTDSDSNEDSDEDSDSESDYDSPPNPMLSSDDDDSFADAHTVYSVWEIISLLSTVLEFVQRAKNTVIDISSPLFVQRALDPRDPCWADPSSGWSEEIDWARQQTYQNADELYSLAIKDAVSMANTAIRFKKALDSKGIYMFKSGKFAPVRAR
ncbi:hypothetical protein F4804DRAFT_348291 [Jackrogersella minutella]|nr:hypothetical protein F4804DRAFT_348291 [Jackrogersella minutella]